MSQGYDDRPLMLFLDCGSSACEAKWMVAGTNDGVADGAPRAMDSGDQTCPKCSYPESIVREWGWLKAEKIGQIWVVPGQPWLLVGVKKYKPVER